MKNSEDIVRSEIRKALLGTQCYSEIIVQSSETLERDCYDLQKILGDAWEALIFL